MDAGTTPIILGVTRYAIRSIRMPIKFRCQHCDQFLGIAKSRAGALVDCPRCGETLRVPGAQTVASKRPPVTEPENSLVSALSELSALADGHVADDVPAFEPVDNAAKPLQVVQQAVPNIAVASPVQLQTNQPPVVPVAAQPVDEFEDESLATTPEDDSLAELAALSADYSAGEISPALLDEMRSVSRGTGQTVATLFGGVCILLLGIAGGWYLAKSGTDRVLPLLNLTSARQRLDVIHIGQHAPHSSSPTERIVSGIVQYENASGKRIPDSGALLLIVPVRHPGTLILNSQSILQKTSHPDFQATASALATLGGRIVQVSADGSFTTSVAPDSNFVAVAVSQHVSRSQAVPIADGISNVLKTWFDSPSRLTGRKAVTASPLGENTSELRLVFPQ